MTKRIVILSDLWGATRTGWTEPFEKGILSGYDVDFYDSCELGEIDMQDLTESNIHRQFVDFGIDRAVDKLLDLNFNNSIYVGCSIGGYILWKAALQGLHVDKLITMSATRIRYEISKPDCDLSIYFGSQDPYKPYDSWYESMDLQANVIVGVGHELYTDEDLIKEILEKEILQG